MSRPNPIALRSVVVALLAAASTIGCTDNAAGDSPGLGPQAAATEDLGARVYTDNCASCHGADLRGTEEGPSQLSIVYEPNHHPDDAYRAAIRNGAPQHHWSFGDMPPVEGLSAEQVEAVIRYIRSEQERQGFEP